MNAISSIDLQAGALVISDLHLDAASATGHEPFLNFLAAAGNRPQLWILGDLFDAWVGPAHARLPGASSILSALRRASDGGLGIALVPGNRDFLLDETFGLATGVRLCAGGILATLPDGSRTLFIHGDELCTLDRAYQRMKRIVRSAPARWLAPRLPDAVALAVARRLRKASTAALVQKPAELKRQQIAEVRERAVATRADTLVCGHAHEYRDERLPQGPRWLVLDAFGGAHDLLELSTAGRLEARASSQLGRGKPLQ